MSLKNKETEQVTFEDAMQGLESEYDENEGAYLTISGKPQTNVSTYEKYGMMDFDVGDDIKGMPEITHFINDEKKYDSLRVRIIDETGDEYIDLYINIPKPDENGFVTNINRGFDFYRTAFDFIYSVLRFRDEKNVIDSQGEEINKFKKVNILTFAKYVDQMSHLDVKITEGNKSSDYDSWIITNME